MPLHPRLALPRFALLAAALSLLAACALPSDAPSDDSAGTSPDSTSPDMRATDSNGAPMDDIAIEVLGQVRVTRHEGDDDLLTAGLGLAGLRAPMPPPAANPLAPTSAELRRMAFHANWRGIADLTPGGAVDTVFQQLPSVPGTEVQALLRLPDRHAPHRVLLQIPDTFNRGDACLVVAPASGSRGVHGAIAVAGPWALPRGCALVMTDKGAGTDVFDPASATGTALDGTRAALAGAAPLAFVPHGFQAAEPGEMRLALRHLHSQDNPEADWGLHVEQAARFALEQLRERFGTKLAATPRVIAVGISNGGGAVLKAAERAGSVLAAVVAGEPNISVDGARSLYDYATEAALLQPCALLDPRLAEVPFNGEALAAAATARCSSLRAAGLVEGDTPAAQAASAHDALLASGWSAAALAEAGLNTSLDLWRAVAAGYASAYARTAWDAMPCGYSYTVVGPDGTPMPAPPVGLALWWALGSGIPPMMGIGLGDALAAQSPEDPAYAGLACLRALVDGEDTTARAVQQGIAALVASGHPRVPTIVVHGAGDGLIPPAFTSRPYAQAAAANGAALRYWEVDNAQHFDAFLAVPAMAVRYVPLLPYIWQALDQADAALEGGKPPAPSQYVRTTPRVAGEALGPAQLHGVKNDPGADAWP